MHLNTLQKTSKVNSLILWNKKGIYQYDYMDSFEKFNETQLPKKEEFYSIFKEHYYVWQ